MRTYYQKDVVGICYICKRLRLRHIQICKTCATQGTHHFLADNPFESIFNGLAMKKAAIAKVIKKIGLRKGYTKLVYDFI